MEGCRKHHHPTEEEERTTTQRERAGKLHHPLLGGGASTPPKPNRTVPKGEGTKHHHRPLGWCRSFPPSFGMMVLSFPSSFGWCCLPPPFLLCVVSICFFHPLGGAAFPPSLRPSLEWGHTCCIIGFCCSIDLNLLK